MQGIILAAGIGSRLRPLTDNRPKCLVDVLNKPILQYQIEAYKKANIKNVIIVSGYLSEKIKEYLVSHPFDNMNLQIIFNKDFSTTNNMYSFWLAKNYIKSEIILLNGDVVFDPAILKELRDSDITNLIASNIGVYKEENMKIKLSNGWVKEISKDIPKSDFFATSIDIYKISTIAKDRLFDIIERRYIQKNDLNKWIEVALQDLFALEYFYPLNIKHKKWIEIDNIQDLEEAKSMFTRI
jgi:choline kinase